MEVSLDHVAGLATAILFMIRQNADAFSSSGPALRQGIVYALCQAA
jgi:hypothetical protein